MVKLGAAVTGTVTVFEVTGVMGVPLGGVPTTEATLLTVPESRSAWVTVCEAEQVVDAPGVRVEATQVRPVAFASVTATEVRVTLPLLVTVKVYGITSPTALTADALVAFTMVRAGVWLAGTVTVFEETGAMGVPPGGVPITEAVFTMEPALRSAWVTAWVPEHVVVAPGAKLVSTQLIAES